MEARKITADKVIDSSVASSSRCPAVPLIGYLSSESPAPWESRLRAFRQGLAEAGYVEGRNVSIEFRWADSHYDRLPVMAADLLSRRPTMIFAAPGLAALAAKRVTTSIPIVFAGGSTRSAPGWSLV
jgi:putative ABC transport system substrate-binding protein